MSKANALAGLISNYGDSDEDSDDGIPSITRAPPGRNTMVVPPAPGVPSSEFAIQAGGIHPPPIPHCPWSACYDETSGFTYYWNQHTNAVTWDAPPEYLLALKLAQQQLHLSGTTEVTAEEWQLYQQALAEKQNSQNKVIAKAAITKPQQKNEKCTVSNSRSKSNQKRRLSDDDTEKIELITSYHNSDSESNEEAESPVKPIVNPKQLTKLSRNPLKKLKTKPDAVEYGPTFPPNQNYLVPIGPEMPLLVVDKPMQPKNNVEIAVVANNKDKKSVKMTDNDDSQDESTLLNELRDKAKLLEKLGGEIPCELQKFIDDETKTLNLSPSKTLDNKMAIDNIDDLLNEIEKKELPKMKSKAIDMFDESKAKSDDIVSAKASPESRDMTPPLEFKPLFPSIKNICEEPATLIPSGVNITEETIAEKEVKLEPPIATERKETNIYLIDSNEPIENVNRKKLRISNSVLPERKKAEMPAYTTKYSQFIEGFSGERTGLGFSKQEEDTESPKNTVSYGKGLTFTKGETLNDEKQDEDLDDLVDLVEAKLKYLNQLQPCPMTPVQEMLIQMQTLVSAHRGGGLAGAYWRRWVRGAGRALRAHEKGAAPQGWTCAFQRSEGRYQYRRESDGLEQWEYPAVTTTDMDICTTPPHQGHDVKEETVPPPLPPVTPPLPLSNPHLSQPPSSCTPPPAHSPPTCWPRVRTPPPPAWADPPPPGCVDLPLLPPEQKKEICDELLSFYNDIAELEKRSEPNSGANSPDYTPPLPAEFPVLKDKEKTKEKERDVREKDKDREPKVNKKKSKVKISSSMGLKHKTVSNLVAKWQQVADENDSD